MRRTPSDPFARKPIAMLLGEMQGDERLHRVLGPLALTSLGVGATIGTGIYVLTGEVARNYAGPSLMLSFLLAAVGCGFAALCYSELASMVPVAGSAYTYAYATLGEMVAWIIGWDLVLEYAIGSAAVANGWSNYFVELVQRVFGFRMDPRLLDPPWDYDLSRGAFYLKTVTLGSGEVAQAWFNLPAALIMVFITALLVVGIKESAGFNAAMVLLNVGVILAIIGVGSAYVDPANWRPFLHEEKGWRGVAEGAARIFFAYIGFDSISTHSEEARNPQRDLAIGILSSLLICTVLYVAVAAVLTGMIPYRQIDVSAPLAAAFREKGLTFTTGLITAGNPGGPDQLVAGGDAEPAAHPAGDGPRRDAPRELLRRRPPEVPDPLEVHDPGRPGRRARRLAGPARLPGRAGQRRDPLRVRDRLRLGLDPPVEEPRGPPARSGPPPSRWWRPWGSSSTAA